MALDPYPEEQPDRSAAAAGPAGVLELWALQTLCRLGANCTAVGVATQATLVHYAQELNARHRSRRPDDLAIPDAGDIAPPDSTPVPWRGEEYALTPPPEVSEPAELSARDWERLRAEALALGSRLAMAVANIRFNLLRYAAAFNARERPPEPYATGEGANRFLHTPDYTTVTWCGEEYHLTPLQAKAVQTLHEWQGKGVREVRGTAVLAEIDGYGNSFSDLFKGSPAWKTLVLPGSKRGSYRLVV